ncbi:hypothetical protein ACFWOJ_35925 [Streptomyces sp. NPDC058439]|uniref:hypothetical protein n=1 Tax=Streptomyces sp. NPDC058439 TaxID=3346500 RepID=UPI0036586563
MSETLNSASAVGRSGRFAPLRSRSAPACAQRDVLPAFVGLGFAVAGPVAGLVWLHRALGVGGLVLGVVLLATALVAGLRWRQAAARRHSGIYTPAELAALDDRGLAAAAERMLRRDGWHVIAMPDGGQPRLYARDRGGRQLDIGFRPADEVVDEDAPTGPAPLREAGRPGIDNLIRVVVSRGSYSRADVLWASRQGGVHLVDSRQPQQWAAGAPLDNLGLAD